MDFDTLKIFYRAAQAGSFLHSGVHLSPSAIGRKIALLEQELGATLFLRMRNKVALTESGFRFLAHVENLFSELDAAKKELALENPAATTITVVTPTVWATGFIHPALHDYLRDYPHASIKLIGKDQIETPNVLDLMIQVFPYPDPNSATENYLVGKTKLKLYAHRDYAQNRALPKTLSDLREHRIISHANQLYPFVNFNWFLDLAKEQGIALKPTWFTNNVFPFLKNAFGIATIVENHPLVLSGELIEILPTMNGPEVEIFMTVHKTQKDYQQVINFKKILMEKMGNKNFLEGFK